MYLLMQYPCILEAINVVVESIVQEQEKGHFADEYGEQEK